MVAPLTLIALVVLGYALLSRRLASTVVTAPIFFAAVGFVAGPVLGLVPLEPTDGLLIGLHVSSLSATAVGSRAARCRSAAPTDRPNVRHSQRGRIVAMRASSHAVEASSPRRAAGCLARSG